MCVGVCARVSEGAAVSITPLQATAADSTRFEFYVSAAPSEGQGGGIRMRATTSESRQRCTDARLWARACTRQGVGRAVHMLVRVVCCCGVCM